MVAVYIDTLQRLAGFVIDLLEHVERVDGVAHLLNLDFVTNTAADATRLHTRIGGVVVGRQACNLVLVVGYIEADFPTEVLLLDGNEVQGNFNTLVLHIADVLQQIVGQVGTSRNGHEVQQVVGLTLVDIDATVDSVLQETEVKTSIVGRGLLPLNLGGIALRSDRNNDVVAEPVVRTSLVGVIGRN